MSDIKYIIAGDDEEHTRFPCLAMVRYAVAAVVTVLALAVVAMVFHAVLRSEDIGLSVNNGFIGADTFSRRTVTTETQSNVVSKLVESPHDLTTDRVRSLDPIDDYVGGGGDMGIIPRDCFLGCSGGVGSGSSTPSPPPPPVTTVTYQRATTINLRVILVAINPGGRTRIDCNGTTLTMFDMRPPYQLIAVLPLGNFTVQPQTISTLQGHVKITDQGVLAYIWNNYGGEDRFSVVLQVSANVTSYPLGQKSKAKEQTYLCRPVTIGLINDATSIATDEVQCSAEKGQPAGAAPAPAPAP